MVPAFVIVALVLLLPITNDIYLYFDFKIKKPVFLIKIWGVKLLGGYIRYEGGFLFFHYGDKKAFAFKTANAKNMKFKPKYLRGIKITELSALVGAELNDKSLIVATLGEIFARALYVYSENTSPIKTYKINFELKNDCNTEICFKCGLIYNLMIIISVFVGYIVGNLCDQAKKKKK